MSPSFLPVYFRGSFHTHVFKVMCLIKICRSSSTGIATPWGLDGFWFEFCAGNVVLLHISPDGRSNPPSLLPNQRSGYDPRVKHVNYPTLSRDGLNNQNCTSTPLVSFHCLLQAYSLHHYAQFITSLRSNVCDLYTKDFKQIVLQGKGFPVQAQTRP